jgi:membrane protein YqaA with SNARE-associated domain
MSDSSPQAQADSPTLTHRPSWYRRLYHRVESYSQTKYAVTALLIVSFVDASVFPIPPFALLVPMVLAQPKRWAALSLAGTITSFIGGLLGYWLGVLIHGGAASFMSLEGLEKPITWFGLNRSVGDLLGDEFWILALLCSILPTPFKVVSIGSGFVGVPLPKFMLAAIIGRAVRFFLVGGAMAYVGPRARKWLRV